MNEMFLKDLEILIEDGQVSEIDVTAISYTGVDELNTTLRCMTIGDEPFRWMSFRLKRFMYPGVYPYYHTLNEEEDDIRSSVIVHDTASDLMTTILKFIESEKGGPCHQKIHFFVDRENVIIVR